MRASRVAVLLVALCACAPRDQRTSLILVSIDTLRADHLGLYGYERDTSPFLDRWSRDALVFERAYAPCPWTLPSHMTMLTGLYPQQHGVTRSDLALSDGVPLLAERLQAAIAPLEPRESAELRALGYGGESGSPSPR